MDVTMDEVETRYHGRRERCAVVFVQTEGYPLTIGDTARAARDMDSAAAILRAIAARAGIGGARLVDQAPALQAHCRKLTKFRPDIKRDRPRPRPQRVSM